MVSACSGGDSSENSEAADAIAAGEVLAVSGNSAPLTRDQFLNLAMALAVGENFDGQEIVIDDDLLRTLAAIHIRSTAIIDLFESDEEFEIQFLADQAQEGVEALIEEGLINPLEPGSVEFLALQNIILADRGSNPLRGEVDPATGESVVGDNPFTNSFVLDPNLARNFETVSPGFLAQFDETFADFTADVTVDPTLGTWNTETFSIDEPS